jgi:hypothetical protein
MYASYESARIERQARDRAYLRPIADPERAWAARERRDRPLVKLDLARAGRSLRVFSLALLGLF